MILPKRKPTLYEVADFADFREMLANAVQTSGDTVAVKHKGKGIPSDVTYNELLAAVDAFGTGLMTLAPGNGHVALISPNSYRSITVFLTVLCSEGVFVPIDRELPFSEIINILNHSDCETVVFDKAFADLFIENKKSLPGVRNYICFQTKEHEEHDGILSYKGIYDRGLALLAEGDDRFTSLAPSDKQMRMLVYKAGSTDSLRGVMLSQYALRSAVINTLRLIPYEGRYLSVQPYDRATELVCGLLCSFHSHCTVCINASLKNFQKDLREYKPNYLFLPPLYVENIWMKATGSIDAQGRTETLESLVKTSNAMRRVGIDKRRTFFSSIVDMMGGALETVIVSGAAINPEAVRFFDNVGISVLAAYSVTECTAIVSANREKRQDFASAGTPLPCVQIRIDDPDEEGSGEICVRGDLLMTGYYKNERATKDAVELSGWLHTGDIGKLGQSGQLYITGRLKSEIILKNGRSVLPDEIESYLRALPFVKKANVYAGKDEDGAELSLCADLVLDSEQTKGLSKAERVALVKEKIDRLNKSLPSYKRLDKIHIRKDTE